MDINGHLFILCTRFTAKLLNIIGKCTNLICRIYKAPYLCLTYSKAQHQVLNINGSSTDSRNLPEEETMEALERQFGQVNL